MPLFRDAHRSQGGVAVCSRAWLSFRRIVDIPFETCVGALDSWQHAGQGGELRVGHSMVRGPVEHDSASGTCRMEVRLARGPLRPLLRMQLDIDRWTWSPARTALELIPCQRVRPAAAYFRAGHLLLDSLIDSLPQHVTSADLINPIGQAPPRGQACVPETRRGYAALGRSGHGHGP